MVNSLSYETISTVIETWEEARRMPAFEENIGLKTLSNLFELDARTKTVFGLPLDFDLKSAKGLKMMGALIHAKRMVSMLDAVLDMLGPDQDIFTDLYAKLGKKHEQYGVKASYFPLLGEALIIALAETLGPNVWSYKVEEAWTIVYGELCSGIVESMSSRS